VSILNRNVISLALMSLISVSSPIVQAQPVTQARLPTVQAESLNEKPITVPANLPCDSTLLLIAFEREQQKNIDTWVVGLKLKGSKIAWLETPVINPQMGFVQGFINGGMRRGIPDTELRDRTVTLFTDRKAFIESMKLGKGTASIYAAVVDRAGAVLAVADGDYSEAAAALLMAKMETACK
jgi:hypothetical protein